MSKQTIFLTLLILSVLLNLVYSLKKIKRDDQANEDDTWASYSDNKGDFRELKRDDEINEDAFQGETMWKKNDDDDAHYFYKRKWRHAFDLQDGDQKTLGERKRCALWGCHIKGCQKYC